jgi:xanthine/CO dehydrogenase XdhC/CoxF family maturation factor
VVRKTAWLTRSGAVVERYSTPFDETAHTPFGLGCGGVLDVLLESIDTAEFQAFLLAVESIFPMWAVFRADGDLIFAGKVSYSAHIHS